jgi:hypothetical protein
VPEIWYKDYPHLKEIYTKDMIKIRIWGKCQWNLIIV